MLETKVFYVNLDGYDVEITYDSTDKDYPYYASAKDLENKGLITAYGETYDRVCDEFLISVEDYLEMN